MKLKTYNQLLDKYSRMGCIRYGIGHIMLFKYGLFVTNNYLLKTLDYFEKIGVWDSDKGAIFSIFYDAYVKLVNKKLDINVKVVTKLIYKIFINDTGTYGIGIINYHSFGKLIDDGVFDKFDVDQFIKKDGVGHHLVWDGSQGGYLINSNGSKPIKCTLDTLKYMAREGMIRNNVRTIEPVDDRTKEILSLTLFMQKSEQKNKLKQFLEVNKDNEYLGIATKLYNYGRKQVK